MDEPTPWEVDLHWEGETVVCIGGGPSLNREEIVAATLAGVKLIGVNDAYRVAPWVNLLWGCDYKWWEWHSEKVITQCEGILASTDKKACSRWPQIKYLPGEHKEGLSWDRKYIYYGMNGGYQAVNIATLSGAKRVLLIGYDHRVGEDGKRHWFGNHPDNVMSSYENWIQKAWPTIPPSLKGHDCEVINCTPGSAITAFPRMNLAEALAL